jgi:diguanylate cyclase (GGDEF)-like protein/PAS domain S-box-containing protein
MRRLTGRTPIAAGEADGTGTVGRVGRLADECGHGFARSSNVTYGFMRPLPWASETALGHDFAPLAGEPALCADRNYFATPADIMTEHPEAATAPTTAPGWSFPAATETQADASRQVSEISHLLRALEEAAAESGQAAQPAPNVHESKLVEARLGMASGLFAALRAKHPPTATHCLRVAIGASTWATSMGMDEPQRGSLEVAALLHDVGKIGVPDKVLLKPGRLLPEEAALMSRHGALTVDILASCGAPDDVLSIVHYSRTWYGTEPGPMEPPHSCASCQPRRHGADLPTEARMLAIVDAFDSMTTETVYRPARSRERALAELFACAGRQFDPDLVREFNELFSRDQNALLEGLAGRWLCRLPGAGLSLPWQMADENCRPTLQVEPFGALFEKKLIDNMHDGVFFVDSQGIITLWNTGAERLTGVSMSAACGRSFSPSLLDMRSGRGQRVANEDCPVANAITAGVQWLGRVAILGRQGRLVSVDLHAIPVRANDGVVHGATILLHDASSETSLEERCQALHAQVAKDPLTQVANRAEFDRMLVNFVAAHQESNLPCSLIMCDIDHFKSINDKFGHQAGDEAITKLASLLKSMCRSGDLVARYGGEEFAILCADCNIAVAARKAEEIRKCLAEVKHVYLGNRSITASFGVTVLQAGDTPETLLRRADRALLLAKDQGRNQVVQLGDGMMDEKMKKSWWPFQAWTGDALIEATLVTAVPIEVAVQKLRGFIADQNAKIAKTGDNELVLEVTSRHVDGRRSTDRPTTFMIELQLSQNHVDRSNSQGFAAGSYVETRIDTMICPRREKDRQRETTIERARRLLGSLKSYLMAHEEHEHNAKLSNNAAEVAGD